MQAIVDFLSRHDRVVLQFSAGKDSAACLKLLRPWLDRIQVVWVNPGRPYPETVAYMEKVRQSVPYFVEVTGRQPQWVKENGYPCDFYSVDMTTFGSWKGPKLNFTLNCCNANLWQPMLRWMLEHRITGVIRGSKRNDGLVSPVQSGQVIQGMEFLFPLEDWTDEQVMAFVGEDLPDSYRRGLTSSLDCATCTGYLKHNPGRREDLRFADPEAFTETVPVFKAMNMELLKLQGALYEC